MSVFDTSIAIQQQRREDETYNARSDNYIPGAAQATRTVLRTQGMGAFDYNIQSHNGDSFLRNALVLYSLVRCSLSAFRRLRYVWERLGTGLLVLPRLSCMRVWVEFGNEAFPKRLICTCMSMSGPYYLH